MLTHSIYIIILIAGVYFKNCAVFQMSIILFYDWRSNLWRRPNRLQLFNSELSFIRITIGIWISTRWSELQCSSLRRLSRWTRDKFERPHVRSVGRNRNRLWLRTGYTFQVKISWKIMSEAAVLFSNGTRLNGVLAFFFVLETQNWNSVFFSWNSPEPRSCFFLSRKKHWSEVFYSTRHLLGAL